MTPAARRLLDAAKEVSNAASVDPTEHTIRHIKSLDALRAAIAALEQETPVRVTLPRRFNYKYDLVAGMIESYDCAGGQYMMTADVLAALKDAGVGIKE